MAAPAYNLVLDLSYVQHADALYPRYPHAKEETCYSRAGGRMFQIRIKLFKEFDNESKMALIKLLGNKCGLLSLIAMSRKIHSSVCCGQLGPHCEKNHLGEKELTACAHMYASFPATIKSSDDENDGYAFSLIPDFDYEIYDVDLMQKILRTFQDTYPDKAKDAHEQANKRCYGLLNIPDLCPTGHGICRLEYQSYPNQSGNPSYHVVKHPL